jgi:hypothetical protein
MLLLTLGILMLTAGPTGICAKVTVGVEVVESYETPHPYSGFVGVAWEKEFHWPDAGYIAIHFSSFDLALNDFVEISSPDGKYRYIYEAKGKEVKTLRGEKRRISEFWATHIPGDRAIVRLHSKNQENSFGFVIDRWVHGYERGYIDAVMEDLESEAKENQEAICGIDDKEWAKCYDGTTIYDKSRTVSRLLIGGYSACTGWLLGSEGHVITNHHCIENQAVANNTDYEFMAEGDSCSTDCTGWMACPGVVEADAGTLVKTDYSLDYSLILLPVNVTSTYGYLQFRNELPTLNEEIYMPQHPGAGGKQLAVNSDINGPKGKVYSIDDFPCVGGPGDIGYYLDTEGGSSGSPVIAAADNLVVALHHCSYYECTGPNLGIPIPPIVLNLGNALPADAVFGGNPPPGYCSTGGAFTWDEWIAGVQLNDFTNMSGAAGYSDFTYMTVSLNPAETVNVVLTPGYSYFNYYEFWKIWIDYNGDMDFEDEGEEVFSGSNNDVVTGSFTVPIDAQHVTTRMRVSMKFGDWPGPCEYFYYGEVEDYTLVIEGYCVVSGESQENEWIERVRVGNDLDSSSGPSGYSDFTYITGNLKKGSAASFHLTPGFSGSSYNEDWKIWIDYNQDEDFNDPGEEVAVISGKSTLHGVFKVPKTAMDGNTRMRIAMRYGGRPPVCGTFEWGEVEDYTVNIK